MTGGRKLIAYRVGPEAIPIVPSAPLRTWMEDHPERLAHNCHPLIVANQLGWQLLNPFDVDVKWTGRPELDALRIKCEGTYVLSNFGGGIVTWRLPYLFRTPPGWHLWVKGPSNVSVHGASPLEGFVETDQAHETFTMNWQMTKRGRVKWSAGHPICQLVPVETSALGDWQAEIQDRMPEALFDDYSAWVLGRLQSNNAATPAAPYHASLGYRRRARVRRVEMRPPRQGR